MTDYVFEGTPGYIQDALNQFNVEQYEEKMKVDHIENKHLLITIKAEDEEEHDTVVKVKFYKQGDFEPGPDGSEPLLVNFARKSGNIAKWYGLMDQMK